jgi:exodeoxyribonuclease VII large subunit
LRGQLAQAQHRLTVSGERITHSARTLLRNRRDRFAGLEIRLRASKLSNAQAQRQTLARDRERVLRLADRARRALASATQRLQARVEHSGQLLGALSYRSVLARGFALVRDEQGHALRSSSSVDPGARLDVEFADGRVAVTADTDASAVGRAKPASAESNAAAPRRRVKPIGQGSLF